MSKETVLIIGHTLPEPSSTAAGNRMSQLIHFFLDHGYTIVFSSTTGETGLSMDLDNLGIEKVTIHLNDSDFDTFIKELHPNIVVFDRFLTEEQFGWRVAQSVPTALRILDTEDLHSLRNTREVLVNKDLPFTVEAWLQNELTKREIASIYRCDLSLIISSFEMELLTGTLNIDENQLIPLPFMLSQINQKEMEGWEHYEERRDFICIGNGKHAPNVDAIVWLKKEIWPKIRKEIPKANLLVYGAYLPKHIEEMHNPKEGFLIKGWIDDAKAAMGRAKINLVPLRFGAGLKGKVILGMQAGTPNVSTSIAAEGISSNLPWSGKIEDKVESFVQAAIQLYTIKKDWLQAQQNGISIINQDYNKELLAKQFLSRIKAVQKGLYQHRIHNFIGSMLLHHTISSTKYMSKWIEEKNRKT